MEKSPQEYYRAYQEAPLTKEEKEDLEQNKEKYLQNGSFDKELAFGTGGVREIVAPGTNRLNVYNIARLSGALAKVVDETFGKNARVIIAADSRLSSPEFSKTAAFMLKKAGLETVLFQRPTPTPLLSFAVREFQASAGVVITASHNPPEYNGFKVYWDDGGQIVSPLDRQIEEAFQEYTYGDLPRDLSSAREQQYDSVEMNEETAFEKYLTRLKQESFVKPGKEKKTTVLYSPLHGTGGWFFEKLFRELGFTGFQLLSEQARPDGNFPTLSLPNPEEESSFALLKKKGLENKTALLMASDPDADRIGAAIYQDNGYLFLTGNQIGALLMDHLLATSSLSEKAYVCKTIVTSPLQNEIAKSRGVIVKETLTGFKFIADEIKKDPEHYVFGGEESFGYLPVSWVRDKDSLSSGAALAELAEETDLAKHLEELYIKHGLYSDFLYSIKLTDSSIMDKVKEKLQNPEKLLFGKIGGREIIDILDLQKEGRSSKTPYYQNLKKELPVSTVVQYMLEPLGRLTIRPSGTEPKVKVYLNLKHPKTPEKGKLEEMKKELAAEAKIIQSEFFKRLEIEN